MEGFYIGVEARGDMQYGAAAISIEQTDFDKNSIGVRTSAIACPSIIYCSFHVGHGRPVDETACNQNIGIHTLYTPLFRIEENSFTGHLPSGAQDWRNIGVLTEEAQENNNEIYKNSFNNFYQACLSIGRNRSKYLGVGGGLKYLCNNFYANTYDVFVSGDGQTNINYKGINPVQGYQFPVTVSNNYLGAGNTFSNSTNNLVNYANTFSYYHNGGSTNPIYFTPNSAIYIYNANQINYCPTKLGSGSLKLSATEKSTILSNINSNSFALAAALSDLEAVLDGGNPESLMQYVNEPNQELLYNALLSVAPFLSESTMRQAANASILTQQDIIDILIENPDLIRNPALMEYLCHDLGMTEIEEILPELMDTYGTVVTERTNMEERVMTLLHVQNTGYNHLITSALNDSTSSDFWNIPNWLDSLQTISAAYQKAVYYKSIHENDSALMVLNNLSTVFEMDLDDYSNKAIYTELFELIDSFTTAGLPFRNLNSNLKSRLASLSAESSSGVQYLINNILEAEGSIYPNYCATYPPIPSSKSGSLVKYNANRKSFINVFPNPANESVQFLVDVNDKEEESILISITNLMGQKIHEIKSNVKKGKLIWDVSTVPNGNYIYQLRNGKKLISTGKLSILH